MEASQDPRTMGRAVFGATTIALSFFTVFILTPWWLSHVVPPNVVREVDGPFFESTKTILFRWPWAQTPTGGDSCLHPFKRRWLIVCSVIPVCIGILELIVGTLSSAFPALAAMRPLARVRLPGGGGRSALTRLGLRLNWTWGRSFVVFIVVFLSTFSFLANLIHLKDQWTDTAWWAPITKKAPFPPVTPPVKWVKLNIVGSHLAWPGMLNFMVALIPVSRTAPLLSLAGVGSDEAKWLHKTCARLAVFCMTFHGLFKWIALSSTETGTNVWAYSFWRPRSTLTGFTLWGEIALFLFWFIGLTSLPAVRRRFYRLFKAAHLLAFVAILFAALHHHVTFFYFLLPLNFYFADFALRTAFYMNRYDATLSAVGDGDEKILVIKFKKHGARTGPAPGQDVYLRVPCISQLAWHPFTVVESDGEGGFSVVAKAAGRWTFALFTLAAESNGAPVPIDVQGPYNSAPAWLPLALNELQDGARIALFAGGSGLSGFAGLLQAAAAQEGSNLKGMSLVWSVRALSTVQVYRPLLAAIQAKGASVSVHVTRAQTSGSEEETSLKADSKASVKASKSGLRTTRSFANGLAGLLILILSVAASASFYTLGAYSACQGLISPERKKVIYADYVSRVSDNMLKATGSALKADFSNWPANQLGPAYAEFYNVLYTCKVAGKTYEVQRCHRYFNWFFPYGRIAKCDDASDEGTDENYSGQCIIAPGVLPPIFSLIGGFVVPLVLAYILRAFMLRGESIPTASEAEDLESAASTDSDPKAKAPQTSGKVISLTAAPVSNPSPIGGISEFPVALQRPDLAAIAAGLAADGSGASGAPLYVYLSAAPAPKAQVRKALSAAWASSKSAAEIVVREMNFTL